MESEKEYFENYYKKEYKVYNAHLNELGDIYFFCRHLKNNTYHIKKYNALNVAEGVLKIKFNTLELNKSKAEILSFLLERGIYFDKQENNWYIAGMDIYENTLKHLWKEYKQVSSYYELVKERKLILGIAKETSKNHKYHVNKGEKDGR